MCVAEGHCKHVVFAKCASHRLALTPSLQCILLPHCTHGLHPFEPSGDRSPPWTVVAAGCWHCRTHVPYQDSCDHITCRFGRAQRTLLHCCQCSAACALSAAYACFRRQDDLQSAAQGQDVGKVHQSLDSGVDVNSTGEVGVPWGAYSLLTFWEQLHGILVPAARGDAGVLSVQCDRPIQACHTVRGRMAVGSGHHRSRHSSSIHRT
jgi:hypothetical protein